MDLTARYEIIDLVGTGRYGTVFRARDRLVGFDVAIKQIHHHLLADPALLELFWRDLNVLAGLDCPALVRIFELIPERGWVVMELLRGSLAPRAQAEPLEPDEAHTALMAGLEALQAVHTAGMRHGAVHPANLMRTATGRIKLAEFGPNTPAIGLAPTVPRPPARYVAPEYWSDQTGPSADLYSLGMAMYELVVGERFAQLCLGARQADADHESAWQMWQLDPAQRLPDLAALRPDLRPDLASTIQRLAAKDPAQRYPTAAAALDGLLATGSDFGAGHRGTPPTRHPGEPDETTASVPGRRRASRPTIAALAVMAVVGIACLIAGIWPGQPAPSHRTQRLPGPHQQAVARLLAAVGQDNPNLDQALADVRLVQALAPQAKEVQAAYGAVLVRAKRWAEAETWFRNLSRDHPQWLLPKQALAWLRVRQGDYRAGVEQWTALVRTLAEPGRTDRAPPAEYRAIMVQAGQIREFLDAAALPGHHVASERLAALDAAVEALPAAAQTLYRRGRLQTQDRLRQFDRRIQAAETYAPQPALRTQRSQLEPYAPFPFETVAGEVRAAWAGALPSTQKENRGP